MLPLEVGTIDVLVMIMMGEETARLTTLSLVLVRIYRKELA
jgi:hypothetical protein